MDQKKLNSIKREMAHCRRNPQKAIALQRIARQLGREPIKRGKEPMWESSEFRELFVLAIPDHGGRDLAIGTKKSILDQLEEDVLAWEQKLQEEADFDGEE